MKRYISAVLIPCLLLQLCGCYSSNLITTAELVNNNSYDIEVIDQNDNKVYLNSETYELQKNTLRLLKDNDTKCSIAVKDIKTINADKFSLEKTVALAGIGMFITLIVIFVGKSTETSTGWTMNFN